MVVTIKGRINTARESFNPYMDVNTMYPERVPPLKSIGINRNMDKNFDNLKSGRLIA